MIGKVMIGKSFKGCISYCLEDKKIKSAERSLHNRSRMITYNLCFGNKRELIRDFNDVRALNRKLQKPVLHITLSFAPGEKLPKEKLFDMVQSCARFMGFEKNQYIALQHMDTAHQHIHIVANRIGFDGKTVSDSNSYHKISAYCRAMEKEHGLQQILNPKRYLPKEQRHLSGNSLLKNDLRISIQAALQSSKNINVFISKMQDKGYKVIKGRGIVFINKKGVKTKGSEVGFSLMKINLILEKKEQVISKINKSGFDNSEAKDVVQNNDLSKPILGIINEISTPVEQQEYMGGPFLKKKRKKKRNRRL